MRSVADIQNSGAILPVDRQQGSAVRIPNGIYYATGKNRGRVMNHFPVDGHGSRIEDSRGSIGTGNPGPCVCHRIVTDV
ncbi:hypothetical protein SDC9_174058 [bioreactor metagenome]|uniref:Uncharacterized protein n=1 Tax=bioreactor metagenome TaxID=1076179 RepID=A0A645GSN0_9ZZZZ